jgi:ribonuclease HI
MKPGVTNTAKYEACLHGLHIAIELGVKCLMVYDDSAVVINQVNKDWSYTSDKMDAYCSKIRKLEANSTVLNTTTLYDIRTKQPTSYPS